VNVYIYNIIIYNYIIYIIYIYYILYYIYYIIYIYAHHLDQFTGFLNRSTGRSMEGKIPISIPRIF
jgi:hypothetical protein